MHEDGFCDIVYDDGDTEENVAPKFIKVFVADVSWARFKPNRLHLSQHELKQI